MRSNLRCVGDGEDRIELYSAATTHDSGNLIRLDSRRTTYTLWKSSRELKHTRFRLVFGIGAVGGNWLCGRSGTACTLVKAKWLGDWQCGYRRRIRNAGVRPAIVLEVDAGGS